MPTSGTMRIVLSAAFLGIVSPALAQRVILDAPGLMPQKKAPAPEAPRAQANVWPRLDPGAVLCRTEDDLDRHAANMVARVSGGESQSADCHTIAQPIGIQILSREGPGRTQVKLKDADSQTGWTDVWLPEKAPVTR